MLFRPNIGPYHVPTSGAKTLISPEMKTYQLHDCNGLVKLYHSLVQQI
jgi:hypothetical protein